MRTDPEFKNRFFEGILLPDKLTKEYISPEPTHVEKILVSKGLSEDKRS